MVTKIFAILIFSFGLVLTLVGLHLIHPGLSIAVIGAFLLALGAIGIEHEF